MKESRISLLFVPPAKGGGMESVMRKVILWEPDTELIEQMKELMGRCDIVASVSDVEDIDKGWKNILFVNGYDDVIISYKNFTDTKQFLKRQYDLENVYTFYEYRVKDEQNRIVTEYTDFYNFFQCNNGNKYFSNKNVLVLGGGSGIGYACAEAFTKLGANILIAGRNRDKLLAASSKLEGKPKFMIWDIDSCAQNERRRLEAKEKLGAEIDILINAAGQSTTDSFFTISETKYDDIMNTNLKGMYFLCQEFAKHWINIGKAGSIVNILSIGGFKPTVNPYGISKWGGRGLTIGLGHMLAKYGITVNGVAPAEVATEFIGWHNGDTLARRYSKTGRITLPAEVASVVVYLSSFMGRQMPGKIIEIDGGDDTIKLY